ncbi:GntP family permease [Nocardioides sp.]|uniref:GntP family permease n=1 Tax=Nocardioides sp. TaxID=35761 RepID=UPI002B26A0FD|nr:GntP family permease [Nocardioides sp.]
MIGLFGIILSLVLLIALAYRGINVIILAPLMALLATAFAGGLPLIATYTQVFMPALGNYLITYFPLFLLGALFGKLMDDSGAARAIAHFIVDKLGDARAILAIVLACGILTYGGVSLFVVAFAVFPIAAALFREAGVPKRLIPATIALGSFTFTMTALPGTPQIQNAIPAPFFGTDAFAAPGLGVLAALIMFGGGTAWLMHRASKLTAAGETYLPAPAPKGGGLLRRRKTTGTDSETDGTDGGPVKTAPAPTEVDLAADTSTLPRPSALVAFLPIVVVIALNYVLVTWVFPSMDTDYLAGDTYGNTDVDTVGGIWAIAVSLVVACLIVVGTNLSRFTDVKETVNEGTMGSFLPIFNTASEVGYGAVIASLPAFKIVRDSVLGISNNPVISLAVAVNVLAGITGSASGGMSIALQTLGEEFRGLAVDQGIALELMHRVTVLAAGGFDALPHNGAVVTVLAICGLTHRQSYKDIFVVAVAIPLVALTAVITLGTIFGSF